MKKSLFISLIFVLAIFQMNAQNSNKFHLSSEFGVAFTGTGDNLGLNLSSELSYQFLPKVSVGTSLELQQFNDNVMFDASLTYKNLGLNFYYTNRVAGIVDVIAGVGAFGRRTNNFNVYGFTTIIDEGKIEHKIYQYSNTAYWGVGYTAVLGVSFPLSDRISIPLKFYLQNDTNGDIASTLRTGLVCNF